MFDDAGDWSECLPAERSTPVAVLTLEAGRELRSAVSEWYVEDQVVVCAQILGDFLMGRTTMAEALKQSVFEEGLDGDTTPTPHSRWIELLDTGMLVSDRKERRLNYDAFGRLLIERIERRLQTVAQ